MAERKETNPFHTEDTTPHLPPSVYQPNPFPLNPAEGNPWAGTPNDQPYQKPPPQGHVNAYDNSSSSHGHSYNNTSSDGGSQSNYSTYTMPMPMPTPSVNYSTTNSSPYSYSNSYNAYDSNDYNNVYNTNNHNSNSYPNLNAYNNTDVNSYSNPNVNSYSNPNVNAYETSSKVPEQSDNYVVDSEKRERENTFDDNTTELDDSVSAANPGIETHDPNKLKISSDMVRASLSGVPNKWRLLSRFIQFLASAGAFVFILLAPIASKQKSVPDGINKIAVVFLFIVSIVSIIYSFGHLIFYCLRRWSHKNKVPRWLLLLIDAAIGASLGTLMVFLIKDSSCSPGKFGGWCDYYNTAIFFTVLAFVTYAVSFIWDIVGGVKTIGT